MSSEYTLIGSWALLIGKTLDSYGLNGQQLCQKHSVDLSLAASPDHRFDSQILAELWRAAVVASNDPAFGLRAGSLSGPSTFRALSAAMWMSDSLRAAFQRNVDYSRMFATTGDAKLVESTGTLSLEITMKRDANGELLTSLESTDALMATVVTLCRALYRSDFCPSSVRLMRTKPDNTRPYSDFFRSDIEYDAPVLAVSIPTAVADAPLSSGDKELAFYAKQAVENYLARMDQNDYSQQARHHIQTLLTSAVPSCAEVAARLNTSVRSLQIKLKAQGTSFQTLLESERCQQAEQYLQSTLSIGEIGFLLGFSNSASFSRAFKRWKGTSPAHYRRTTLSVNTQ